MARKETNFKQTDIGLIPHDWEVKEITDIASISTGGQNTQDAEDGGVYPFYVRSPKVERINSYLYDTEGVVTAGDGVGVGKVFHYVNGKFGLHQRCYLIHRFEGAWAKYFYMYFSLQFYNRVMSMTAKSSVDSVRRDMIAHMLIPVPPIEEQKRIAEVLSHFEEHIDNLAALLEKRRQVKAATMHALLSGATRLPGFTQPWEEMMLGDLCEFRTGYTPSKSVRTFWENGTIPWFRMDDIRENGRKLLRAKQYVTEEAVKGGGLFEAGSFILATTATIGEHAWLIADSLANQRFTNLKIRKSLKNTLSAHFFFYYLYIIDEYCKRNTKIGTFAAVDIYDLKAFKVPTPPLKEQEAIASVLSNMDRGIEALEQEIKKYRQMKEGAMEELLTGKVRLI